MSEPVAYLATNPTHPSNADALVWEPKDWHITWEFKPLYLHPDPRVAELEATCVDHGEIQKALCKRVAELEAVLRECRDVMDRENRIIPGVRLTEAIAKIDKALK